MNISAPFVRRPIAVSLLALAIFLAGVFAYTLLPVAPLPRVDFPTIQVSASFPGASAETMASSVATPLERRFGRIAGVTEITSSSSLGSTSLTLQFDIARDVDAAARDVQAAIAAAASDLPPNLPLRPTYRKVNPADSPIMILSLTSDTLLLAQVYDTANTVIAQSIAQVEGVGQVFVGGGQQPAVRVQIDPAAVAGLGVSLEDVRTVLGQSTVDLPKGSVTGPRLSRSIRANDQLMGAAAYRPLILAYAGGAPVRLSDVAKVFDDVENNRVAAWTNGVRSVLIIVRRQPGANIIATNDRVRALLPNLTSSISPGIRIEVALDRTQTIRASVRDVELTLILSVILVTLVVFVFLRTARGTLIPAVAVPLSLMGTFGAMYLLDYSLDNLSLMALTISTGFVIDDAIVVTENIARHIEAGASPVQAALKGAAEIGFTIVSITVSLLAVFIPILFMGGIVGRLFRELAVTLSVAIALSAVIALTLTPAMCACILQKDDGKHGRLFLFSERVFDALLSAYGRALRWVLRHSLLMQIVTVFTVALTVVLYYAVPKGLFPQQDTGMITGFSEAPQDVSFQSMRARQEALNAVMMADPDIAHTVSFVGGGYGASAGNTGTMFLDLKPASLRKADAMTIIARLRPKLAQIEGINVYLQAVQDVRVGGRASRTQYQYTLQDVDLGELGTWAGRVVDRLRTLPTLQDVASDQQNAGLELDLDIDRDTASRLGIAPRVIDNTLYDAFGQRQVATIFTQLNQYRVVLEVLPQYSAGPDALDQIYVMPVADAGAPSDAGSSGSSGSSGGGGAGVPDAQGGFSSGAQAALTASDGDWGAQDAGVAYASVGRDDGGALSGAFDGGAAPPSSVVTSQPSLGSSLPAAVGSITRAPAPLAQTGGPSNAQPSTASTPQPLGTSVGPSTLPSLAPQPPRTLGPSAGPMAAPVLAPMVGVANRSAVASNLAPSSGGANQSGAGPERGRDGANQSDAAAGRGVLAVPLRQVVVASSSSVPLSVNHQGQFPSITVSFNLSPNVSLGQAVEAIHRVEREIGMPPGVHASFTGTAQAFQASLASEPMLIIAALLAVYMVLGVLYESYVHPITILSTLPTAGIGALLALLICGTELSVIALIGIILLIGIVKKNAILMIDFAIEAERDRGLTSEQAIYEACVLRFRPIMMTTLSALIGALPLAIGSGTGSELRRPLGITIVGGLLVSQALTLFTTPVIYLALDRLSRHKRAARPIAQGSGPATIASRDS